MRLFMMRTSVVLAIGAAAGMLVLAGCAGDAKEETLVVSNTKSKFGQIGTGATARGTAGGGTRSTYTNSIASGSYGHHSPFAQGVATEGQGAPVRGAGFATASVATEPQPQGDLQGPYAGQAAVAPSAFVKSAAGKESRTLVRDHSSGTHANAPAPGGFYRENSLPAQEVGVSLPSYYANPATQTNPPAASPNALEPDGHHGAAGQESGKH